MLKSYFKIVWRNIIKHKVYTLINVLGLALGVCSCIVIYLITSYDLTFDTFHSDKERIYRVVGDLKTSSGEQIYLNNLPSLSQEVLKTELSGVEVIAGFYPSRAKIIIHDDSGKERNFDCATEDGNWWTSVIMANPNYFKIFKYDWLAGNAETSLDRPYCVVLSENRARKYFGLIPIDQIIGKEVIYNDTLRVRVSGIVKDWNKNTDFPFTDFISLSTASTINSLQNGQGLWTFVKLSKEAVPANINVQLKSFNKKYFKPDPLLKRSLRLQPLSNIHFNSDYYEDGFRKAHLPTIYSLIAIAFFILIIAIVNFINLSTAQSIERAKEIGVRKVLGVSRTLLIFQFLTETVVLTFFAVCIGLLLVKPVLSVFDDFIPNGVILSPIHLRSILFLLLLTLITTFLAGLYPAIVLSSYLPVMSLKGIGPNKTGGRWTLRNALIIFQFTVSLVFIIGAIVINNQIRFMRHKDLGYNTADIIILKTPFSDSISKVKILAEKIKQLPAVSKVALEAFPPIGDAGDLLNLIYKGKNEVAMMVAIDEGNEDFIPLYQMRILAGRNLMHSDSLNEFILNESLSRALGFSSPAEAIGKFIYSDGRIYPIVGVVADYHIKSLHNLVTPVCIGNMPREEKEIAIKLALHGKQLRNMKATLSEIEKSWKEFYPKDEFGYNLLNESIAGMYEKEEKTATLMNIAMTITIIISCIGLFGLVTFTTLRRTKEIGIRKVLGASVSNITAMLSKDFVLLAGISLIIASPIAGYFMHNWLQDFAYRINIEWWIFLIAGLSETLIAIITVSFRAIHAASTNPAKSLKTE